MSIVDRAGRLALGWVFIQSGLSVLRTPEPHAKKAAPVIARLRSVAPVALPDDIAMTRINAATHVVAGTALSLGIAPRLAAATLVGSLIPTTLGGHRFWEMEPGDLRNGQRNHLLKNISILGGLLQVVTRPRTRRSDA